MKRKNCTTCRYGCWLFHKYFPTKATEKCSECVNHDGWEKKRKHDMDIKSISFALVAK
ncbi:hypothetical protein KAR91_56305 [Candidatus Pacearchaeota archaeon]|nr:hypothetical protein [Candidatus Pacearchaeota archaeon]